MSDSLQSLQNLATEAANEYGVPLQLFMAQIGAESSWNPNAIGTQPAADGEYAEGIAQFLPSTASSLNINPMDPSQAIPAAAEYDSELYAQNGDNWLSALEAYGTLPKGTTSTSGLNPGQTSVYNAIQSLGSGINPVSEHQGAGATDPALDTSSASSTVASLNPGGISGLIPNIGIMILGVVMIFVGLTRGGVGGLMEIPQAAAKTVGV